MTDSVRAQLSSRFAIIALIHLLIAASLLVGFWWSGRPVALVDVAGGRVQCLSYSPPTIVPSAAANTPAAQIRADLERLADYTQCVRTYSVDHGLDQVPQIARELELEVMLGIWIGMDEQQNEWEIARALELAHTHRDVIQSIVVGNEVLLRREQTPAALSAYLRRVRAATDLPITYADVWEFWEKNAQLAPDVSFVTVHMLPYWEDSPVPIEGAVPHVGRVLEHMRRLFPRQPVVIGEAGWPSAGRQRAGAVPGRVNQARFFREFTRYADAHGVQYNLIEAFDQPWKRTLEGTVGGAWGLFDAQGRLKFPLQGPVENDPQWHIPIVAALVGGLLVFAVTAWVWRGTRSRRAIAISALAACSGAAMLVVQWEYLLAANRSTREWLGSVAWFASGWIVYLCATLLIAASVRSGQSVELVRSAARSFGNFDERWRSGTRLQTALSLARMVFLLGLAYIALLLTIDPRYRDFPVIAAVLPVAALWLYSMVETRCPPADRPIEEILLTYWLIVAGVWITVSEGFQNVQALLWCGLCLWVALTVLWSDWRARGGERAQQQAERGELDPV